MSDDPTLIEAFIDALNGPDGYPTNEGLMVLRTFTGTPHQLADVLEVTFGRMGSVWVEDSNSINPARRAPYIETRPFYEVNLATGGWSGNESMISAMRTLFFWFRFWESSRRGGGYTFTVPKSEWEKPMMEWPPAVAKNEALPTQEDLAQGHLFEFSVRLRGVHRIVGDPTWIEDGYWSDPSTVSVRGHSLKEAFDKVTALPFATWFADDLGQSDD